MVYGYFLRNCYNIPIKPFLSDITLYFKGFLKTTNFWSLVFVIVALFVSSFLPSQYSEYEYLSKSELNRSFGGPTSDLVSYAGAVVGSVAFSSPASEFGSKNFAILDGSAVIGYSEPVANLTSAGNGLKKYKVQSGDTLSSLAVQFNIDIETIRSANPGIRSAISPGQNLIILPVKGIAYEVKSGDSLELISALYEVNIDAIKKYNPEFGKLFASAGQTVILPYAKNKASYLNSSKGLPDLKTYFVLPARGWNWGELHEYNAVDIADSCGKPIYASAEGVVVEESSNGFWNSGYGNYVLIEHPNGVKTRYAHTSKNLVRVGDYVSQSSDIALIGNTGNSHGPSGCHLHFEVYGAKNPFAIK